MILYKQTTIKNKLKQIINYEKIRNSKASTNEMGISY